MNINCLSCGFKIGVDDSYEDYEGAIRCPTCKTLLVIQIEHHRVKKVLFSSGKEAETAILNLSLKPDSPEGSITQRLDLTQDHSTTKIEKEAESPTYIHETTSHVQQ
ncbi:MAG: hypothetical protein ACH350_03155 [Parachlamydiaceae bacterium]